MYCRLPAVSALYCTVLHCNLRQGVAAYFLGSFLASEGTTGAAGLEVPCRRLMVDAYRQGDEISASK